METVTYKCECGKCSDTVSTEERDYLAQELLTYPEELDLYIQLLDHAPMDDYQIMVRTDTLCLCKMKEMK